MKIILVLSAFVAAALAAPARDGPSFVYGVRRAKKSAYGAGPSYGAVGSSYASSYGAPCGHGSVGGYAASAPVPLYLAPQGGAHYREDEDTEGENTEMTAARSYGGGYGAGAAAGGQAVGVFPNAKLGGCAVPLLLSCAPSVVSGHVVQHGYSSPSYKEADEKEAQWAHAHALRANDAHDDLQLHLHKQEQNEQKTKKQ